MAVLDRLLRCTGFDWDEGNAPKIWEEHEVSPMECEQVFFNLPLVAGQDEPEREAARQVRGCEDAEHGGEVRHGGEDTRLSRQPRRS